MNPLKPASSFLMMIFTIIAFSSSAQIVKIDTLTHWKKAFRASLNFNQASFTSNWKAGGVNSLGLNALLNYKVSYKGEHSSWDNELDFQYGMVNNQGLGNRKTLDRIFIDTKYGYALNKYWDLSLAANFPSQFAPGYQYLKTQSGADSIIHLSDFVAPAYLTMGIGAEYHPVSFFKVRVSPLAPRLTVVNDVRAFVTTDNPTPYGVSPNRTVRMDWLSAQLLAEFDKDLVKNLNLKWRYMLVANYQDLTVDHLYHRVDMNITAKVGKFFNASLGAILLYDHNQDNQVQLSQAFSFGMLYTFQNFKDK